MAIVTKGCLDDWNWVAKPLHLILFFVGFLLVFWAGFSGAGFMAGSLGNGRFFKTS
ncbi:MAG: hypothetical protein ACO4AI_09250 [Prochlorothrix sp.]